MAKIRLSNSSSNSSFNQEHKTLRIFDSNTRNSNGHRSRNSRIPVLSRPQIQLYCGNSESKKGLSPLKWEGSRIPVYKNEQNCSLQKKIIHSANNLSSTNSHKYFAAYGGKTAVEHHATVTETETQVDMSASCSGTAESQNRFGQSKRPPQKSLKLRGLQLIALPKGLFLRKDLEALFLSPERESCLEVGSAHRSIYLQREA